ncbi:MAG: zinc-binding alcohol dehydrogenase family protein, partial [Spirochaetales bacterium]
MKALGIYESLPVNDPECFVEFEKDKPVPGPRDLIVKVKAVSVNPVDTKVRRRITGRLVTPKILGWDASGIVEQIGAGVTLFKPGDEVYYAGDITRDGTDSEYHAVDERIAGRKPGSLSFKQAAAMPLTTITAWEALFERLGAPKTAHNSGQSILIIGGAGGVGSIAIQLSKKVAGLKVIATASRKDSAAWCRSLGADIVIDHTKPFREELSRTGEKDVRYILCLNSTESHLKNMADVIKPQGRICT